MEEERNGDNSEESREMEGVLDKSKQSWQWSLVRDARLSESNQAGNAAGNCPRRVSQLSLSFFFFFIFLFLLFYFSFLSKLVVVWFRVLKGTNPSRIQSAVPSKQRHRVTETKILSQTETERKKKTKNQPSRAKPMIHGPNRRVRIWAAILLPY